MPQRCVMAEPLECGGKIVDVWFETMPDGKTNGYIACVCCDKTKVLKNVKLSFPPLPQSEIDLSGADKEISLNLNDLPGPGDIDPERSGDLLEWAKEVRAIEDAALELEDPSEPLLKPFPVRFSSRPAPKKSRVNRKDFKSRRRGR